MKGLQKKLRNQHWRLNNLYHISNKKGKIVQFEMNAAQEHFYWDMHYWNVILKARQLGFSTFIALLFLDVCIFNHNIHCGIIDSTLDDAKKKLGKIKFAYDRLPAFIRRGCYIVQINAFEIVFSNGSSISVGTSHRGGTLQYLHISELGKTAAKAPEKSREIMTGALNTVEAGQFIFIESTAEGQDGDFYRLCKDAELKKRLKAKLTNMDFKFHFSPWYADPEYCLPSNISREVKIGPDMARYFAELKRKDRIALSLGQKAWYVKKKATQLEDMKREYPATPKEAFEATIHGAIFGPYIEQAEDDGRIGHFPVIPEHPVHTFWDIGRKDYNSIWFAQVFAGRVRCVRFYQNCLAGLPHYAEYIIGTEAVKARMPSFLSKKDIPGIYKERGWKRGVDIFPHDIEVTEWGSDRSRIEQALTLGMNAEKAVALGFHDGINAARATINITEFDEEGCEEGLRMLRLYRWKWDEVKGAFITGTEDHAHMSSHGAAAFRYLGTSHRELPAILPPQAPKPTHQVFSTNEDGSLAMHAHKASDIIAIRKRLKALEAR